MKRLIMVVMISATVISANAQYATYPSSNNRNAESSYKSELKALQNFENQLDQFSYSLMVNDEWLARKNKSLIIKSMEMEIIRTKRKIDELSWGESSYSKRSNQMQYRSRQSGLYSKRNGSRENYMLNQLNKELEEQRWIKYKFETTTLMGSNRRGMINKKTHRKLMYQYRDLLRDKLEYTHRYSEERRG